MRGSVILSAPVSTGTFHAKLSGALTTCADMTWHEVWDWWKTAELYGTYEKYAAKVEASIAAMLRGRPHVALTRR